MHLGLLPLIRRLASVFVISCFLGLADAGAYDWMKYEADHLTLFSDCSPSRAKSFAGHFAAYQHTVRTLLLPPGAPYPHTTLVLFNDSAEYERYFQSQELEYGKRIILHYTKPIGRNRLIATVNDYKLDERIVSVLEFDAFYLPAWYDEAPPKWMRIALQDTLSNLRYRLGSVTFKEANDDQRISLKKYEWRDWPVVLGKDEDRIRANEKTLPNTASAQRWLLGDWMLFGARPPGQVFFNLLQAYRSTSSGDMGAFEQGIGMTGAALTAELRRYYKHAGSDRSLPFAASAFEAGLRITPANPQELHLFRFHLLFGRDPAGAAVELEQAKAGGPSTDALRLAQAFASMQDNDRAALMAICREAIAAGTSEPFFYLTSANCRLFNESYSMGPNGNLRIVSTSSMNASPAEVQEALADIRIAQRLDPANPLIFAALAQAIDQLPTPARAHAEEISPGVTEHPNGRFVRIVRGNVFQRIGATNEANADFEHILRAYPDSRQALFLRERRDKQAAMAAKAAGRLFLDTLRGRHSTAETHRLISEKLATETNTANRRAFRNELDRLEQKMAWEEVNHFTQEEKWTEVEKAAKSYVERFPDGQQVNIVKSRLRQAREILGH